MRWAHGYTLFELQDAQSRYGLSFPPDLVALLHERTPVDGYDWTIENSQTHEKGLPLSRQPFALFGLRADLQSNLRGRNRGGDRNPGLALRQETMRHWITSFRYVDDEVSLPVSPALTSVRQTYPL